MTAVSTVILDVITVTWVFIRNGKTVYFTVVTMLFQIKKKKEKKKLSLVDERSQIIVHSRKS